MVTNRKKNQTSTTVPFLLSYTSSEYLFEQFYKTELARHTDTKEHVPINVPTVPSICHYHASKMQGNALLSWLG